MDTLSTNHKILIASLVGFAVGAGAVLVWNVSRGGSVAPQNSSSFENNKTTEVLANANLNSQVATVVIVGASEHLAVNNQEAGNVVYVTTIVLEREGWVAVHEDINGSLGNVLGAAWFPKGTSSGSVELLRDTRVGGTYHAVLYTDDNDKIFELGEDAQLVNVEQEPVMDTFEATQVAL